MRLWLLHATGYDPSGVAMNKFESDERFDYDCAWAFVVRAETEAEAREIAQSHGGDEVNRWTPKKEKLNTWLDPSVTTCLPLGPDGTPGLVIEDYHAG